MICRSSASRKASPFPKSRVISVTSSSVITRTALLSKQFAFSLLRLAVVGLIAFTLPACVHRRPQVAYVPPASRLAFSQTRPVRISSGFRDANLNETLRSCLERHGFKITSDPNDTTALTCLAEVKIGFSITASIKLIDQGALIASGAGRNYGNGTLLTPAKTEFGVTHAAISDFDRSLSLMPPQ